MLFQLLPTRMLSRRGSGESCSIPGKLHMRVSILMDGSSKKLFQKSNIVWKEVEGRPTPYWSLQYCASEKDEICCFSTICWWKRIKFDLMILCFIIFDIGGSVRGYRVISHGMQLMWACWSSSRRHLEASFISDINGLRSYWPSISRLKDQELT